MPAFKSKSGIVDPFTKVNMARIITVKGLFDEADQFRAIEEGWFVGLDTEVGVYDILDDLTLTFSTAAEARAYVEKCADQGSDLHERALAATVALTIRSAGKKIT